MLHCCKKCALAQEIRFGSPDCFSSCREGLGTRLLGVLLRVWEWDCFMPQCIGDGDERISLRSARWLKGSRTLLTLDSRGELHIFSEQQWIILTFTDFFQLSRNAVLYDILSKSILICCGCTVNMCIQLLWGKTTTKTYKREKRILLVWSLVRGRGRLLVCSSRATSTSTMDTLHNLALWTNQEGGHYGSKGCCLP